MAKTNTTEKKTTTSKTTAKKTTTRKRAPRKPKRKKVTELNLWTYNENRELENVKVPIGYRMEFLRKFGVQVPNKSEVVEWLENLKTNS